MFWVRTRRDGKIELFKFNGPEQLLEHDNEYSATWVKLYLESLDR